MGFRASPLAVEVNGSIYRPGTLDFEDSGSVTFLETLIGNLLQLQAFTGTLVPGSVQPGTPGLLVSTGGSGALDTEGVISAYYSVENYKAHYDNGFRLQFRGVWNVDAFVSTVGLFVDDGINAIFYQAIRGYTPTLTVAQDAYTDWGIVDIPPPVGMTDTDPLLLALGAGNDSIFFGWSMLGATVEYRWVDANADPTATAGAIVLPGTVDGQIPIWADQKEVYEAGSVAVEGVDVLSTGEGTGLVLTSDGADGASWDAPGGANVGGCSVTRYNTQSINNTTWTALGFEQEVWDTDGYKAAGYTTDIVIPTGKGGKYVVCWSVPFASNATGVRRATIQYGGSRQGTDETFEVPAHASHDTVVNGMAIVDLSDGTTLNVMVYQSSGGALSTSPGGSYVTPWLQLMRIGD